MMITWKPFISHRIDQKNEKRIVKDAKLIGCFQAASVGDHHEDTSEDFGGLLPHVIRIGVVADRQPFRLCDGGSLTLGDFTCTV